MILKPPTNYAGSKDKLMPQLLKFFPESNTVDRFYDVFTGGLSVSVNSPYQKIIANDIIEPLIKFYFNLKKSVDENRLEEEIVNIVRYKIDKKSKDDFLRVREEFNKTSDPYLFFALVSSCTNNMMRFNKSFKFNQTFGERTINDNTIQKIRDYASVLKEKNIYFSSRSYLDLFELFPPNEKDFIYLDPPYLISEAGYNAYWSKELEEGLYKLINHLDSRGIRFMMSNVSKHKGKENPHLDKIKKYNIVELDFDYEKVSRKKGYDSQEIIIMNF
jgi:DNA adenine methylase Dam